MTTLVFPGQGSQYLGMAKDFYNSYKSAKDVFEKVEESTKIKVKDIIFNNPENLLNITKYTQICIFTASMAIFEVFSNLLIFLDPPLGLFRKLCEKDVRSLLH